MPLPQQKNIDQYFSGRKMADDVREKILAAITPIVYSRNQNVIKAEKEAEGIRQKQYLRSVAEYDQIIDQKIEEIIQGKNPEEIYDFQ